MTRRIVTPAVLIERPLLPIPSPNLVVKPTLFLVAALLFVPRPELGAADLFVAPTGRDDNPGTLQQPLRTLAAARDAARKLTGAKAVFVRGGRYELERPLKLEAIDSGVSWSAYHHEQAVILGGRRLTGFTPYQGRILKTQVGKGVYFRQLLCDGQRQPLARYPNRDTQNPYGGGWAYVDGASVPMYKEIPGENKHTLLFKPADARHWAHPEEGEVFVFPRYNWWNNLIGIKAVDAAAHTLTLVNDCSYAIRPFDRYYVRNLFEELDAPGEWYLDRRDWTLYFWPPAPLAGQPVDVPMMRTILELGPGTSDVTFRGFTFECCEGTAITLKDTTRCLIAASTIRNVGDYKGCGVQISGGSHNGVAGCDIHATGSHGISLSGGDRITLTPAGNYADNNYIHHVGVFHKQGVGVHLTGCGNRAAHNLIHDGPRMGIQFAGNNLVIEFNHLRHLNLETDDTGAIYTGGRDWLGSRGSVIRYNYIHDMLGYGHDSKSARQAPEFAWGIYLDDNTGGVDVIGNIVARCSRALIHLHNARDNFIDNNIFVAGNLQQIEYSGWLTSNRHWVESLPTMIKGHDSVAGQPAWRQMRHMDLRPADAVLADGTIMAGNVLTHNIVFYQKPDAKLYAWRNLSFAHNRFDSNLVWHAGQPLLSGIKGTPNNEQWAAWQKLGNDAHSLVADPLFVNAGKDDYRLQADSPAFQLGFKPIPSDQIGPYRDELRASWPIVEAAGARETPAR